MRTTIIYILTLFLCLSLNSCSKNEDDSTQESEKELALSSLNKKSLSLSLVGGKPTDKARFDIGNSLEYFKLSSGSARKVKEPYYKYLKNSNKEAALELEFAVGSSFYYWEIFLTYTSENSGSYYGYVEYGNDDNLKEENISGTFTIDDYSNENGEEYADIDIEYLTKNVWFSTETNVKRFFAFYDDYSYKHYCDLNVVIVKDKGGKYVYNDSETTLKLYDKDNYCDFDFKVFKLTESELWLGVFEPLDKKYPSSPTMKFRVAKDSDNIPRFITDGDIEFTLSSPSVTDITTNSAEIKGIIYSDADEKHVEMGICYSKNETPTVENTCIKSSSKNISVDLANLETNTTYYVRLYVKYDGEVIYGKVVSFKTKDAPPVNEEEYYLKKINIEYISWKDANNVRIYPEYIDEDDKEGKKVGLCYSTSPNPTITDYTTSVQSVNLDQYISGLKSGTVYYIRPYIVKNNKPIYYKETSFETIGNNMKLSAEISADHEKGLAKYEINMDGTYEIKIRFYYRLGGYGREIHVGYFKKSKGSYEFNVGKDIWKIYHHYIVSARCIETDVTYNFSGIMGDNN